MHSKCLMIKWPEKKDQAEMFIHTLQEFSVFDLVSVLRLWHLYGHQIQFLAKFGPNWPDTSLNMITWLRFIKSKGMCKLYLDSTQPGVWSITASWATTYIWPYFIHWKIIHCSGQSQIQLKFSAGTWTLKKQSAKAYLKWKSLNCSFDEKNNDD